MKIFFQGRYFRNDDEWDQLLSQLFIPENKRDNIDEIELDVVDFTARDFKQNKLKL